MDMKEEPDSGSDEEESPNSKAKRKRTFTKIKDVNKPKLPHTAYIMFLSDRRRALNREGQNVKNTELNVMLANEWKVLDESVKEDYHRRAREARAEYDKKMEEYRQTDTYKEFVQKRTMILKERRMYRRSGMDGAEAEKAARRAVEGDSDDEEEEEEEEEGDSEEEPAMDVDARKAAKKRDKRKRHKKNRNTLNEGDAGKNAHTEGANSVPIFSKEFLEYNKERESALRAVRKKIGAAEEEERLLRNGCAKLEANCQHVRDQLAAERKTQDELKSVMDKWTRILTDTLGKAKLNHAGGARGEVLITRLQKAMTTGGDTELIKEARAALHGVNFNV